MRHKYLYIILLIFVNGQGLSAQHSQKHFRAKDTLSNSEEAALRTIIEIDSASQLLYHVTEPHIHSKQKLTLADYPTLSEQIVTYYENNGYPFTAVTLKNADTLNGNSPICLMIDTNRFITFDSIVLKGDVKLSTRFLYPYLGLKKHATYSEQLFKSVPAKLSELPFATVIRESGVSFVKDKAYLYLFLDPRKTNQFDGYLGIVPVNEQTGKVSINGEINLALQNLLRHGESFALTWRSTQRYSQYLNISAKLPYLLQTHFGIAGTFLLNKQDTSYLTLNYHIGVPYAFTNNNYLQPYFDYTASTILNSNLLNFDSDTGYIDYHKTLYGLIFRYRKLDYLFNPRKGFDFQADFSAGKRIIIQNAGVDSSLYQNLDLTKTTYRIAGNFHLYIPVGKNFVIVPRVQSGSMLHGPHYYNELFDIGGENMIRGFNEDELRASTYLICSAEVRYLFGKMSYLHVFFDIGAYEQQLTNHYLQDFPFGFGAGISFATKAGMFYLDYALGKQLDNPISLRTGKIHFGVKISF